ncbi:unnamed protein product [Blumeria hordei]|uniref:Glutathione synthetase n=2 Tax=Blumeria hordei TaxID=2867405 RepID=A0A383UNR1_BLUHO|nr:Gluthathione synthetase [Blumeria hordei DH14]SZF01953.1 unnamed protein product [Blumeria hordei]
MITKVSQSEKELLVSTIEDWSASNGLAIIPAKHTFRTQSNPNQRFATTAPVTLFPSPFPQDCFAHAKAIQKDFNQLYAAVSQDDNFLLDVLADVFESDEFSARLWKIHEKVKTEGYTQNLSLGLFRSDYLVHMPTDNCKPLIKQVEFNTISASFAGLSSLTSKLHRYLAGTIYPILNNYDERPDSAHLPQNESALEISRGLLVAFHEYSRQSSNKEFCILFVVQSWEENIFDQRHLEYILKSSASTVPVFRVHFSEILSYTKVANTQKRELLYSLPSNPAKTFEVAVVYLRAGYDISHYPNEVDWDARYQLERSNAIKCPSILTQLAGTKKVQQVLATPAPSSTTPSILEKFFSQEDRECISMKLQETFAEIFPLDNSPAGLKARNLATDPELCKNYVLKPQREGGGHNIYRSAIPPFLKSLPEEKWKAFILMEIITQPTVYNHILRNGEIYSGGVICELGIYGVCLWDNATKKTIFNEQADYLLRTKGDQSEEGGIAAGFGCLDSCHLI